MPSSSIRATNSSGSAKLSPGFLRTFTLVPGAASAPSQTASRSGVNPLPWGSTIGRDSLPVIAEPLQLGGGAHFRPRVERTGRDHFGGDRDAEPVLELRLDGAHQPRVLRLVAVARDRDD